MESGNSCRHELLRERNQVAFSAGEFSEEAKEQSRAESGNRMGCLDADRGKWLQNLA